MNNIIVDGYVSNFRSGTTNSGDAWASFTVGNSTYAGKNEDGSSKYNRHWFDVSTFGGLAETCARNLDGREDAIVTVMGTMQQRAYVDNDGNDRKAWSIRATDVTRGGAVSLFSKESAPAAQPAAATSGATF